MFRVNFFAKLSLLSSNKRFAKLKHNDKYTTKVDYNESIEVD